MHCGDLLDIGHRRKKEEANLRKNYLLNGGNNKNQLPLAFHRFIDSLGFKKQPFL